MSRKVRLLIIGSTVVAVTSALSHVAARALHFRLQPAEPLTFGVPGRPATAVVAGSSLMFFGIAWSELARASDMGMQGWSVPAGSVVEMESLQPEAPSASRTFLGVSISDLNENNVSDYRADIVPFGKAVSGLWKARTSAAFAKRVISQYPLKYVRAVFPTAGRSLAVMVGVRETFREMRHRGAQLEPNERAVVTSETNSRQESITTWPDARRLRNIGAMRESAGGSFEFHGPKRDALFRFLERGAAQGKVAVLVFPESPIYQQEFVTPDVRRRFESLLAEAQRRTPEAVWIRLDTEPQFQSTDYYWDLVHLNGPGQALATQTVRKKLEEAGMLR